MPLRVATRNVLIAEGARDRDVISSSESSDLCKALVPLFGVVSSVPVSMVPESAQEDSTPRIPVGADGSPDQKTVLCQSSKWETSFVATSVQPARISGGCPQLLTQRKNLTVTTQSNDLAFGMVTGSKNKVDMEVESGPTRRYERVFRIAYEVCENFPFHAKLCYVSV